MAHHAKDLEQRKLLVRFAEHGQHRLRCIRTEACEQMFRLLGTAGVDNSAHTDVGLSSCFKTRTSAIMGRCSSEHRA